MVIRSKNRHILLPYHMKNDIVIGLIDMVIMSVPVRAFDVHFYMPRPSHLIQLELRKQKIRTTVGVALPSSYDNQFPLVGRHHRFVS